MVRALSAEERRLLALATAQQAQIADPAVADCWHVLVEAISKGWIGMTGVHSLPGLLTELDAGGGLAVEEISIDVSHEDPSRETAIVSYLADRFYVPRAELTFELRRLLARLRGHAEPRRPSSAGEPEAAANDDDSPAEAAAPQAAAAAAEDPRPLAPIVPLSRAKPAPAPEDDASDDDDDDDDKPAPASELGRALESLAARIRSGEPIVKPGSFLDVIRTAAEKARVEKEQEDAARLAADPTSASAAEAKAATAEAKAAIDRLIQSVKDIDRTQLASALHSAADWVKSPEGGGTAIDSFLGRLEARLKEAFAPKLGPDGKPDPDAPPRPDPSEAIKNVRDAMARRIADAAAKKARAAQAEAELAKKSGKPPADDTDN